MTRILLCTAALALAASPSPAATGQAVFEDLRCIACHRADRDGVGPSLEAMANAYAGDTQAVEAYFRGEREARLDRGRAAMMRGPLDRIRELDTEERSSLAAFLAGKK
jgi:cytochrome c551/c552